MRSRRLRWRGGLAAVICALVLPCIALAEGSWSSNISGALTGFESRDWGDGNRDAASTTIRFQGCTRAGGFATTAGTELRRKRSFMPDQSLGMKTLCSTTGNWGRVASGTYKFRINTIGGRTSGYQLWVNNVTTTY